MPRLAVIVASTRPGRVGIKVGEWLRDRAVEHGGFDVDFVDLAEVGLPLLDEPTHPRLQQYAHQHTKDWSARIAAADAFVFVIPEYDFSMPAALLNALQYLYVEWNHKAAALVSYGGISAGLRSAEMTREVLLALEMYPVNTAISIPFVATLIGEDGTLVPNESMERGVAPLLDKLLEVDAALSILRSDNGG